MNIICIRENNYYSLLYSSIKREFRLIKRGSLVLVNKSFFAASDSLWYRFLKGPRGKSYKLMYKPLGDRL